MRSEAIGLVVVAGFIAKVDLSRQIREPSSEIGILVDHAARVVLSRLLALNLLSVLASFVLLVVLVVELGY